MDFQNGQQNNSYNYNQPQQPQQPFSMQQLSQNGFTVGAIVCVTLALLCNCFALGSIMFGALAIIFALLSRGNQGKLSKTARYVIIGAVVAMVFSVISTVVSIYEIFSNPEELAAFKQQYETMTGSSFDDDMDAIGQSFGIQLSDD